MLGGDVAISKSTSHTMGSLAFLRQAFGMLGCYRLRFLMFLLAIVVQVGFYFCLPLFYREVFDRAIPNQDPGYLSQLALMLGGLFVIRMIGESVEGMVISELASDVMRDLRLRIYRHLQDLSLTFLGRTSLGDLLSRFTNDLSMVEQVLVTSFYQVVFHSLAVVGAVCLMFVFEWRLALVTLAALPLGFLGPQLLSSRASRTATARKEEDARVMGMLQENLMAQKVLRAFALRAAHLEKFMVRLGSLHTRSRDLHRITIFVGKSSSLGVLVVQLVVLLGGGYLAISGYLTGGALVGFLALLSGMGNSARILTSTAPAIVQAAAGLQRVNELLAEPVETPDAARTLDLPAFSEAIQFDDVTFSYTGEEPNLDGVSLTIPAGQSVAFVGRSGSGKSTVMNLITRFYEAGDGAITIDGRDLKQISEDALRSHIGTVFQDTFLFSTTIRENIRQGRLDATDEEVEIAARDAEIHDLIASLPRGYDTQVGEMGGHLSGGQRQRIALARAILRNPSILVLDEATSALDPATALAINATLERLAKDRTMISVTHRLTSAMNMDRVFVMDQGRVVEQGTHRDLLNQKGMYYEMWQNFTLELTQDAVVGEVESAQDEVAAFDTDASPEALAQRVREMEGDLRLSQRETERLRAVNQRWAQLAGTDRLTGLPNKLSFVQALAPQQIQQAQRDGHSVGLMLISGDNLGTINETYGRSAGDIVIRGLGELLQSVLKGEDQLGHLDGTNFAVMLVPAELDEVRARAEEIRCRVVDHAFVVADARVDITVSIGIRAIQAPDVEETKMTAETAFDELNEALFAAKRAGGNRVEAM